MDKITIPMIRRIIPGNIAQELVGVQPMTGPTAQIFSVRTRYSEMNEDFEDLMEEALPDFNVLFDAIFGADK